jgi:hypothetical protein
MIHFTSTPHIALDSSGYVTDMVFYQPGSYQVFEGEIPEDFKTHCYKLEDGEMVIDQDRHDELYPEELDEFGNPINPQP